MEHEDYIPKGNQLNARDYEDRAFETPYAGAPTAEKPAVASSPEARLGSKGLFRVGEAAIVQFQIMRSVGVKNFIADPLLTTKENVQESIIKTAGNIATKTVETVEKTKANIEAIPDKAAKRYRETITSFGDLLNKPVQALIRRGERAKRRKANRQLVAKQRVGQIRANTSRRTQSA